MSGYGQNIIGNTLSVPSAVLNNLAPNYNGQAQQSWQWGQPIGGGNTDLTDFVSQGQSGMSTTGWQNGQFGDSTTYGQNGIAGGNQGSNWGQNGSWGQNAGYGASTMQQNGGQNMSMQMAATCNKYSDTTILPSSTISSSGLSIALPCAVARQAGSTNWTVKSNSSSFNVSRGQGANIIVKSNKGKLNGVTGFTYTLTDGNGQGYLVHQLLVPTA
jgi:hypothetical protein